MSFAIPKIQYKNGSTTGDTTAASGVITNLPSTVGISVGMVIKGSGIPTGATIGSVGANSVTLANGALCTATAVTVALDYSVEICFDFPPKEPKGETFETKANQSESLSGLRQVSVNNIEATRALAFSFVSQTIFDQLQTFLQAHGLLGKSFRYFENKTLSSYVEYELDALKSTPKKIAPKGLGVYVWEVPLNFRRVL